MYEKFEKTLDTIKECIIDYSTPIFIVGNIYNMTDLAVSHISATINREDLIVIGNRIPNWVLKIFENVNNHNNILLISDFEKISTEEQKLFIDIICKNCISSELLPDNLKIIINASSKCDLIEEIADVIQYFEI